MKSRIILVVLLSFFSLGVIAQPAPPGERGSDDNQGSIGSGLIIMLVMAAGYGAKKVYDARRRLLE